MQALASPSQPLPLRSLPCMAEPQQLVRQPADLQPSSAPEVSHSNNHMSYRPTTSGSTAMLAPLSTCCEESCSHCHTPPASDDQEYDAGEEPEGRRRARAGTAPAQTPLAATNDSGAVVHTHADERMDAAALVPGRRQCGPPTQAINTRLQCSWSDQLRTYQQTGTAALCTSALRTPRDCLSSSHASTSSAHKCCCRGEYMMYGAQVVASCMMHCQITRVTAMSRGAHQRLRGCRWCAYAARLCGRSTLGAHADAQWGSANSVACSRAGSCACQNR